MSLILLVMVVFKLLRKLAIWFMYYLLLGVKPKEIARHIKPESRCLDVGAGVGQYTMALRDMGFHVWPLEPDRNKLNRCDVELAYCATGQNIPTDDRHFDFAFAVNVLHHTRAKTEMLAEMIRVSDKVLISELNRDNPLVRIYNRIIGESPARLLNESELKALMLRAGIKRVRSYQRGLFGVPDVFIYASGESIEVEQEDEMSEETQETKYCWQGEFAHCADDCGSMYCELTGAEWNTWNNEDECQECPYGIWNAEDWHEAMEAER